MDIFPRNKNHIYTDSVWILRVGRLKEVASIVLLAALLVASPAGQAQSYEFTKIADSQNGFAGFLPQVQINNSGTVLFAGLPGGVYLAAEGRVTFISEAPLNALNDSGIVVSLEGTSSATITIYDNSGPTVILDSATSQFAALGLFGFGINNKGTVLFGGLLDSGETGLFTISNGEVRTVVSWSELPETVFRPRFNDADNVVLRAVKHSLPIDFETQILFFGRDGFRATVARINDPPDPSGRAFSDPDINNSDTVAFVSNSFDAVTQATTVSLMVGTPTGSLSPVLTTTISPTDPRFGEIIPRHSVDINNNGAIAFWGSIDLDFGIFTVQDAACQRVILEGDPLFGSTLAALELIEATSATSGYFNDRGQIAFHYRLANGVTGIAVATPSDISAPPPNLPPDSTVDAASFLPAGGGSAAPSPGSIVSIFGRDFAAGLTVAQTTPLPTSLSRVQVGFNGIPAPLFFVAPGQINAQLPVELPTTGEVEVHVAAAGGQSEVRMLEVAPQSPSLFTFDQSGSGQGIVVFANTATLAAPTGLTADSHPARAGDALTLFANGLGAVNPPIANGINSCVPDGICEPDFSNLVLRHAVVRPSIEIGGMVVPDENIIFAGLAPQFVALYQINIALPAGLPGGDAVTIIIRQGQASSRADVTMATE